MNSKESFERCWRKFLNNVKGKMLTQKEKKNFSYPVIKLILGEAVTDWENKYDECGRWLLDYCKDNPQKGAIIQQIIFQDMKFTEIPPKKDYTKVVGLTSSVAAAAIGFGVSSFLDASTAVTAAATLIPAAATFPAVNVAGGMVKTKNEADVFNEYINQLDKFRLSIVNVIEN